MIINLQFFGNKQMQLFRGCSQILWMFAFRISRNNKHYMQRLKIVQLSQLPTKKEGNGTINLKSMLSTNSTLYICESMLDDIQCFQTLIGQLLQLCKHWKMVDVSHQMLARVHAEMQCGGCVANQQTYRPTVLWHGPRGWIKGMKHEADTANIFAHNLEDTHT